MTSGAGLVGRASNWTFDPQAPVKIQVYGGNTLDAPSVAKPTDSISNQAHRFSEAMNRTGLLKAEVAPATIWKANHAKLLARQFRHVAETIVKDVQESRLKNLTRMKWLGLAGLGSAGALGYGRLHGESPKEKLNRLRDRLAQMIGT